MLLLVRETHHRDGLTTNQPLKNVQAKQIVPKTFKKVYINYYPTFWLLRKAYKLTVVLAQPFKKKVVPKTFTPTF